MEFYFKSGQQTNRCFLFYVDSGYLAVGPLDCSIISCSNSIIAKIVLTPPNVVSHQKTNEN